MAGGLVVVKNTRETLTIETSSPQDLRSQLARIRQETNNEPRFAEVRICDAGMLIHRFSMPHLARKDLDAALRLDIVEALSVKETDIEFDYLITSTDDQKTSGIAVAMQAERLKEYLECFAETEIIPIALSASPVCAVGEFLEANPQALKHNFCLIHCSARGSLHLAVCINGQFELIREVSYESEQEAEQRAVASLKYTFGRSIIKQLNKLYFTGAVAEHEKLIERLEKKIEVDTNSIVIKGALNAVPVTGRKFLALNLLGRYAHLPQLRRYLISAGRLVFGVGLAVCLFLSVIIVLNMVTIRNLSRPSQKRSHDAVGP